MWSGIRPRYRPKRPGRGEARIGRVHRVTVVPVDRLFQLQTAVATVLIHDPRWSASGVLPAQPPEPCGDDAFRPQLPFRGAIHVLSGSSSAPRTTGSHE